MTRKIALTLAEAEHILRKAADANAMWYKRNAWKIGIICLASGAVIGTIVSYIFLKGC